MYDYDPGTHTEEDFWCEDCEEWHPCGCTRREDNRYWEKRLAIEEQWSKAVLKFYGETHEGEVAVIPRDHSEDN